MLFSLLSSKIFQTVKAGSRIVALAGLLGTLPFFGPVVDTAHAETALSVYGGANFSPNSSVDYNFNLGAGAQNANVSWDGSSFEFPPYYGLRITHWLEGHPAFGLALDFTHSKVKASPLPAGFEILEFTDGINFLTANGLYRHQSDSGWTPYGGLGIGLTIPHVEVTSLGGASRTSEYQVTGIALQAFVGVEKQINDNWSAFGEFKSTYGRVNASLNGGGSLNTSVLSNQVIIGISYRFN